MRPLGDTVEICFVKGGMFEIRGANGTFVLTLVKIVERDVVQGG